MDMKRIANPLSYALSLSAQPAFWLLVLGTFLHVVGAGDTGFQVAAPALLWIVAIAGLVWFPGGTYEIEQTFRQVVKKRFALLLIPPPAAGFVSRTIAPAAPPPRAFLAA